MRAPHELRTGVLAEFANASELVRAVAQLRDDGWCELEVYAPHDLPELDEPLRLPRPRLGLLAGGAGLVGAAGAYWVQWYTNAVAYPLNVGARPPHAVPAFIPSTFETTGLFAAVAIFLGLLAVLRLPRLWHPVFEVRGFEGTSVDRFWVGISARDPRFDPAASTEALRALAPLRVVWLGGGS